MQCTTDAISVTYQQENKNLAKNSQAPYRRSLHQGIVQFEGIDQQYEQEGGYSFLS
jgi:hypothetical protein